MPLTNAYRDWSVGRTTGSATPVFDNANSYIGVGDGVTAFAATQTDLAAATNKLRKAMDATYPTTTTNVLVFRSTFATTDANWVWAEWGIFNAAAAGTMLSRKQEALGTKPSNQSWQFTCTLTFAVA